METFLKQILSENNIALNNTATNTLAKLIDNAKVVELSKTISAIKNQIIEIFNMQKEIEAFKESHFYIKNANAKELYEFSFNIDAFPNIEIDNIRNLDKIGLEFIAANKTITGKPLISCQIELEIVFHSKSDPLKNQNIKLIPFIVNANPRDLWKDIPSQQGDIYAKPDIESYADRFLDKKIVVASKRGRSHAHDGKFRDDGFKVAALLNNWELVAVSDGAGSAKYARYGSKIATEFIADWFNKESILKELDTIIKEYYCNSPAIKSTERTNHLLEEDPAKVGNDSNTDGNNLQYKSSLIKILYAGVRDLYAELIKIAHEEKFEIKDLHSTLIFTLCKKFDIGYIILSFGVGDSPANIISKDEQEIKLLNLMDVGEQSGGTRFITMRSIFDNENMGLRFGVNKYDDFSKLFLMTDGIYDPKFVTENKLEDFETWQQLLKDLNGENEDNIKVDFIDDSNIETQLLQWMDFWSKGNHDDRTLAIIY